MKNVDWRDIFSSLKSLLFIVTIILIILFAIGLTAITYIFTFGYGLGSRSVLDFLMTVSSGLMIGLALGIFWALITVAAISIPQFGAAYLICICNQAAIWSFVFFSTIGAIATMATLDVFLFGGGWITGSLGIAQTTTIVAVLGAAFGATWRVIYKGVISAKI